MECEYIKKLANNNLIVEFERNYSYVFSRAFVIFIKKNNGGRPIDTTFDTENSKERSVKSFLSFNRSDSESIWDMIKLVCNQNLIPFAIDNFGNLICFDISTSVVLFWNHENCNTEFVAETFNAFLEGLH